MKLISPTKLICFALCTFCMFAPSFVASADDWARMETVIDKAIQQRAAQEAGTIVDIDPESPRPPPVPPVEEYDAAMATFTEGMGTILAQATELASRPQVQKTAINSIDNTDPDLRKAYLDIIKRDKDPTNPFKWRDDIKDSAFKSAQKLPGATYVAGSMGARPSYAIEVTTDTGSNKIASFPAEDREVILVGSKDGVDILLPNHLLHKTISRVHAVIYVFEYMTLVVDYGSLNGFAVFSRLYENPFATTTEAQPKVFIFQPDEEFSLILPNPETSVPGHPTVEVTFTPGRTQPLRFDPPGAETDPLIAETELPPAPVPQ